MTESLARVFLRARWVHLVMLNWEIDPARLAPLVPRGTELDTHEGRHFVSLVGFRFENTRVLGVPVPFHRNFEEVNLRFYVRREHPDGTRLDEHALQAGDPADADHRSERAL